MLIDLTLKITPKMILDAHENDKKALPGHLGTHFDVMNKEFPLEYLERDAIVFDVSTVDKNKEISTEDIILNKIETNMFVAFYTGFMENEKYGGRKYFTEHPQLSDELIEELIKKEISIIGIDFAGIKRGNDHTPKDQYCSDRGIFIVENLCNLYKILNGNKSKIFLAYTFPLNYTNMTGLPCRVVAKI
ncbi:MAG: cyclase family protein [Candidatus Caldatribacteriota bacterium]|jgi:kynurenine formamidase|nr:cyclase family protein [Atribacterota bacterium]MDD3030988.1 cyclase family protein [Atribacterota bacterium]MDD3640744.1 cyclase family protein [Atribacterota bacterium]MDD4288884.1 cyclase family protein [Atribacterota bacterium]MDD4764270.1 cyclase family protein [Atribacterota bacterium]